MVHERYPVAFGRDPRIADVPLGLVEHLTDRILEAVLSIDIADHDEVLAIRRPIRFLNVLRYLARRATDHRYPRERPSIYHLAKKFAFDQNSQLSTRRNIQQIRIFQPERLRFIQASPRRKDLQRLSVPRGTVDECLAIRRKARM